MVRMDDSNPVDQYKELIEKTRKLHDELMELSTKVGVIVSTMDEVPDSPDTTGLQENSSRKIAFSRIKPSIPKSFDDSRNIQSNEIDDDD